MKTASAILALVALGSIASADLKSDIKSMNIKVMNAFKHKDAKAFDAITKKACAPNFVCNEMGQAKTREQVVEEMKQNFMMTKKMLAVQVKVNKVTEKGDTGTSSSSHHMSMMIAFPGDKKLHKMDYRADSSDTWEKKGKKWWLTSMTFKNDKMTLDGKPFDPSKMGGPGH